MRRATSVLSSLGAVGALCAILAGFHGQATTTEHRAAVADANGKPSAPSPSDDADANRKRLALQTTGASAPVDVLLAALQRAARNDPGKGARWTSLGRAWVRKARESTDPGFYLNARAAADVALAIDPADVTALDLEGLVLLNDHRFEDARALAHRLVEEHPEDPAAYGTLSDAELELGQFDDAVRSAQQMIDLKPNLPSYSRASYLRWLAGDIEGAERSARLAIDAGGDHRDPEPRAWALVQAALVFLHEGDDRGAEAGFDRALEQMPDYPPALAGKGRIALARDDGAAAADFLARAYRASPLVETAWLLGDARAMAGDAAGAREAYERVERTGKQIDHRTLALFWATRNEHPAEALALSEGELSVRGDVLTQDAYAWALYRNGRLDAARAASDRAMALHTRDARIWYHAGAIRMAQGEARAGRKLVEQALRLEPRFDVTSAAEARGLLGSAPADGRQSRYRGGS
ncbi:MAG: tetratricopeptide repeat protein [Polyangiaceae bacterium]|nr:tetratricopeptide repeat protein [Polyangiaceae bacterium]